MNSYFKTRSKHKLVFFRSRLGKSLIWQKSSATRGSNFKVNRISKFVRKLVIRRSSAEKQQSTLWGTIYENFDMKD